MAKKLNWNVMKQSLDLDEVESVLGINVVSSHNNEDVARCPLPTHKGTDTSPSFSINRDKMAYNCFVCGGGSVAQLVQEIEGLEWTEALEWLVPYVESMTKEEPDEFAKRITEILYFSEEQTPVTLPYFKESVLDPWVNGPFTYYENRGIPEEWCRKFKLGYATHYTKFNPKTKTEWTGEAAIIPHFFEEVLVGYQARITSEDKPLGLPRFDNTSNFPKADTLFGYDFCVANSYRNGWRPVYVCESALTAVYIASLGHCAVSTFGAQVSDKQIKLLRRFGTLVLAFDNDIPGRKATRDVMDALIRHVTVEILAPVEGEKSDLLDLDRTAAKEHMTLTVPASLYDYYMED